MIIIIANKFLLLYAFLSRIQRNQITAGKVFSHHKEIKRQKFKTELLTPRRCSASWERTSE